MILVVTGTGTGTGTQVVTFLKIVNIYLAKDALNLLNIILKNTIAQKTRENVGVVFFVVVSCYRK